MHLINKALQNLDIIISIHDVIYLSSFLWARKYTKNL